MTSPYSHLLLATEHTEYDTGAERVGIDLASRCGVPLHAVLPLVSNAELMMLAPEIEDKAESDAVARLDELQQAARARGVALERTIRRGETPFREIVDEAEKQSADLLILRRRGKRSYLANLLLGEMVHTVTGHAPCDVLIVPRAAQFWSRGIVLATDGSPHSDRATGLAAEIAVQCNLPLTVVSVVEKKQGQETDEKAAKAIVDRALDRVKSKGAQASGQVVTEGKPHEAILAAADTSGADLIVIGRRGLNRVERILVGGTSERVAGSANCAVLIVHGDAEAA
jgi:nucleotide-binding universal stress UspA family protein